MVSSRGSSNRKMAAGDGAPTRIMIAVKQPNGYPHPSISSKGAFEWTLEKLIRSNVTGFKLLLLHVVDPHGFDSTEADKIYASPEDFKYIILKGVPREAHLLEYFVRRCHQIGVACEAWIKAGDPCKMICSEVNLVRPDFLVLGSRGLSEVLTKSVSEYCIAPAECVVMAIQRQIVPNPLDPTQD